MTSWVFVGQLCMEFWRRAVCEARFKLCYINAKKPLEDYNMLNVCACWTFNWLNVYACQ